MDFSNRPTQPQPVAPSAHPAPSSAVSGKRGKGADDGKWARVLTVVAAAVVAILLIVVVVFVVANNNNGNDEDKYVDTSKLQAVFLNTGQVYFGHITTLNSSYFVVKNIYYLQTSSSATGTTSSANTSVSLVKLGCELHEPYDQMVINRSQVTFWENLQQDGQVAKAVASFQKANPDGQKCSDQSSAASTTSGTVQNAGTANASGTSTGTTKTNP